jgi:chromate transporter
MLVVCILKNAIRNKYVQAVLRGLKPCVIGIVLATGLFMVIRNSLPITGNGRDSTGLIITVILGMILAVYPRLTKKKLSPILLICISAVLGMILYGL